MPNKKQHSILMVIRLGIDAPDDATPEQLKRAAERVIENYAGSNDGSELIANADYSIVTEDSN
jgi:aspartate/methionine/tyrosine aminotransferase